MNIWTITNLD